MTASRTQHFPRGFRLIDGGRLTDLLNLPVSGVDNGITATPSGTQSTSYQLTEYSNRVTTVATAADGVKLLPVQVGLVQVVVNAGANAMQVFASGSDTIDGVAGSTGVSIPAGGVVTFSGVAAATWVSSLGKNAGITVAVGTVAAAGSAQGDAAALPSTFNVVTAADGTKGVILPTAVAGMTIIVKNNAAAALKIYPATGAAINAIAANGAYSITNLTATMLIAQSATQWWSLPLVAS